MTPEELAKKHPKLYHTTAPENWNGILQYGLLSTKSILELHDWAESESGPFIRRRRSESVYLQHEDKGIAVITDNIPLHEGKLASCLDDELTPASWLAMLNSRVFLWTKESNLRKLQNAKAIFGRERLVLTFDTLKLARAYANDMEISPINSGATIHQPAQRGRSTFAPISEVDFVLWQWSRGNLTRDSIKEVTVRDGIKNVTDYLICAVTVQNGQVIEQLWRNPS